MSDTTATHRIGFVMFPSFTQLDLTGPWEVLTRLPGAICHLLSHDRLPVRSAGSGLSIVPTMTYAECPQLDMVCVPGGPGHLDAMQDEALLGFLRDQAPACRFVMAVCTGTLVLAAAGLMRGYAGTTHWMSWHRLAAFGATPATRRVVIDRDRITGGGVTAGIDFGLTVVAELAGEKIAREIQLQIEYEPEPPFRGSPTTADPATVTTLRQSASAYTIRMVAVDKAAVARLDARAENE